MYVDLFYGNQLLPTAAQSTKAFKMVLYPVHNLQIWLMEQSKEKGGNRNA